MTFRPTLIHAVFVLLLLLNVYVAYTYFHPAPERLHVSMLDVGQGDAIFIEGPTGIQMLIDGGPDRAVLRLLPREMGIFDRTIDLVAATHPHTDHIAGLPTIFERYRVSYFLSSGAGDGNVAAEGLVHAVTEEPDARALIARRGMRIHLGGGAYADVLYPDRDVSQGDTNDGSLVMQVVYGATSFMLTGDASSNIETYVLSLDSDGRVPTTVLKAGHHGSKYSTSDAWLAALSPQVVAISAGKDNSYGHPSPDALARIRAQGATILTTIEGGTLRFVSDGTSVALQ